MEESKPASAVQSEPPLLEVDDVTISYRQGDEWLDALRNVSLTIHAGETYGLVGESGSGKSTLALAILRYLAGNGVVRQGQIRLNGEDLLQLDENAIRQVWAKRIKLVPQNALSSLNPSLRIGEQLLEGLPGLRENSPTRNRAGRNRSRRNPNTVQQNHDHHDHHDHNGHPDQNSDDDGGRYSQVMEPIYQLLHMVRLPDPERVASSYPHELSGGMQQRVMIALALGAEPDLLVLDEPTTSLDVTTEAAILDLVGDLIRERKTAVLFVSHNLGVVARICDRVTVLYAGELVEDAAVRELYAQPLHPYTHGLLNSVPRLGQTKADRRLAPIPGAIPHLEEVPVGCVFAPRCPIAVDRCHDERPLLEKPQPERTVRCHRWPDVADGSAELASAMDEAVVQDAAASAEASQARAIEEEMLQEETDGGSPPYAEQTGAQQPVLQMADVEKYYKTPRSLGEILRGKTPRQVRAVDGVDLSLGPGRTLGLVGESGSGKTTLARCVIGLTEATGGEIKLLDLPLARSLSRRDRDVLHQIQMVFQNPDEALNPYLTVAETLRRPLLRLADVDRSSVDDRVYQLLEMVKLRPDFARRLPAQLSGGEKQRVAIARAFAARPDLLIFDESVSALDVSVQASILNLLNELQSNYGSAYFFITHDLSVVSYLADAVAVIYLGKLMEIAPTDELLKPPYHPYTEALLSAIPIPDPTVQRPHIRLDGEAPSPTSIPAGCPFHTRCPRSLGEICVNETPPWREGADGQRIFCHIPLEELAQEQTPIALAGETADAPPATPQADGPRNGGSEREQPQNRQQPFRSED